MSNTGKIPVSSQSRAVLGMGGCFALGNFTDNFYKQAAVLMAASLSLTWVQSVATVLFSLPFILFSAWAGWLADRMVKKHIVVAAKVVELTALLGGGLALVAGNWWGILLAIFCMGTQATAFSPALNGSIPEVFPAAQVPRVNSLIKLASTAAVLLGIAAAGLFLDMRPGLLPSFGLEDGPEYGRAMASVFILIVALVGVIVALTLESRTAALKKGQAGPTFPWSGPLDSVRHLMECRKDEPLFLVLLAEAYFYGVAAMAVVSVANLSKSLSYSDSIASLLSAVLMIGVAAGALLAGRTTAESWKRLLFPAAFAMGVFLILTAFAPLLPPAGKDALPVIGNLQLDWLFGTLFLCGVAGGVYLIPLASFIQVRPKATEKGKVLGVSNFLSFVSIALWGILFAVVGLLPPALTFVFYGVVTMVFAPLVVGRRLKRMELAQSRGSLSKAAHSPLGALLRAALSLRYTVEETGLDAIPLVPESAALSAQPAADTPDDPPKGPGILFLPNHPALIDPVIVYSRLAGIGPRPLADQGQMRGLLQRLAARVLRAVIIPDVRQQGRDSIAAAREALAAVTEALRQGDSVLLYPAGRAYRSAKEDLGANSAVAHILTAAPDTRVVLVRVTGLWGSSFSYASGEKPVFMKRLWQGFVTLLCNGLFFTPRRRVRLEFVEPADLPRQGDKSVLNRYLEDFYKKAEQPALAVPRRFWQGNKPVLMAERPATGQGKKANTEVSQETRDAVYRLLRREAGLDEHHPLAPALSLSRDLGLDSLSLMDVAAALEGEFGHTVTDLEGLNTVDDCLRTAAGMADTSVEHMEQAHIPPAWFSLDTDPRGEEGLHQPEGAPSLAHAFAFQVHQHPGRPFLADRTGIRTREQTLTAALALSGRLKKLPGERLGIMLPATPAAVVSWLAVLLAGKTPVMLNWTMGALNLRHSLASVGLSHAVTASALLNQLERQGQDLTALTGPGGVTFVSLEETAGSLSLREKLTAALAARLCALGVPFLVPLKRVPAVAAVLFTSGSEARPKAVPLTHANIMSNAGDVAASLGVRQKDRLLGMLPPFHSFGLLAGVALPASTGLPVAYHPNPTESAALCGMARDYKLTLLGATPSFLDGMLHKAEGTDDLAALRFAFVGAEKCPERVYRAFARCCPEASLCEGYGITECSPAISVNRPGYVMPGTLGTALPSVRVAVVREEGQEANVRARVQPGETGMLLVRGPNVFAGYLGDAPDPFVSFEGEQWYRSGDLVTQDAEGRLTFKGRLKRFVKAGGEMISLPQMESVLEEALSARPDVPDDGLPFVAVETRPSSEESGRPDILVFARITLTVQEANAALREAGLSPLSSVQGVIHVREIPVLGTGKADYQALKRLLSVQS